MESQKLAKDINLSGNYEEVFLKVKKLKDDLHKFAVSFDNYVKMLSQIRDRPLQQKAHDNMYRDIKENFLERIAKEKNNLVY